MNILIMRPTAPLAVKISAILVGVTISASSVLFAFSFIIKVAGSMSPPRNTATRTITGSIRSPQGVLTSSPSVIATISTGDSCPVISLIRLVIVTAITERSLARLSPQVYASISAFPPLVTELSKSAGRAMPTSTAPLSTACLISSVSPYSLIFSVSSS